MKSVYAIIIAVVISTAQLIGMEKEPDKIQQEIHRCDINALRKADPLTLKTNMGSYAVAAVHHPDCWKTLFKELVKQTSLKTVTQAYNSETKGSFVLNAKPELVRWVLKRAEKDHPISIGSN